MKKLAKISNVRLGFVGYQDAMFGVSFQFTGDGWGIGTGIYGLSLIHI